MKQTEVVALAAETGLHWNTVYKWSRDPGSVSAGVRYALKSAAYNLEIELPEGSVALP